VLLVIATEHNELAQAEQFKSAVLGALLHAFPGQAKEASAQPSSGLYQSSGTGAAGARVSTKAGGKVISGFESGTGYLVVRLHAKPHRIQKASALETRQVELWSAACSQMWTIVLTHSKQKETQVLMQRPTSTTAYCCQPIVANGVSSRRKSQSNIVLDSAQKISNELLSCPQKTLQAQP
jgi:hypothetical protein